MNFGNLDSKGIESKKDDAGKEYVQNAEQAQKKINEVHPLFVKNPILKPKADKIINLYENLDFNKDGYEDKVKEINKEILYLFQGIDYNKIDKKDISDLKNGLANFVQFLWVTASYMDLYSYFEELETETDKAIKDDIALDIKSVNKKIKEYKTLDYKNSIIKSIEQDMATGNKGPGNNGFGNRGGGFRPDSIDDWEKMEDKKLDHELKKKDKDFELEEKRHKLKNPSEDKSKSIQAALLEIANKELAGTSLNQDEDDLLDADATIRTKVDKLKKKIEADNLKIESIAKKLVKDEKVAKLSTKDQAFYQIHEDAITQKINSLSSLEGENKETIIKDLAAKIAAGTAITGSVDETNLKKYKKEILETAEKILEENKIDSEMVSSIVYSEINNIPLTEKQLLYSRIPGERTKIDTQLAALKVHRAKLDFFANEIVNGTVFTDPDDKKFYEKHKADIDEKIPAIKEANLKIAKENLITKIVAGVAAAGALTPAEEKLEQEHKAELDPKILAKLKEELALATATVNGPEELRLRALIESRIRISEKSKEAYEPLIKRLKDVSARIEKIEAENAKKENAHGHTDAHGHGHADGHGHDSHAPAGHGSHDSGIDDHLLHALKKERDEIYASLDKLGPSGRDLANLEVARDGLAKASQEFQKSFVRKFPGAKILGVMAGMFGSKWSALKESDKTAQAQAKMHKAQASYDQVREKLMNVFIGEEYAVREAWGQDLKNLSTADTESMKAFLNSISKQFIDDEYRKLDEAKNVLEGTVRGSAMRRFGEWYSKGGFYKNVKNPVLRKVLNRVTSGAILSAGIFLVPGVGAGAAFGSYVGYRAGRAAISGTVGESAALGVATLYGGKLNDKGEFEKLAAVRDAELKESREKFTKLMMERLGKEEKPLMTTSLMQKLNEDHARAVGNYMNSQGNVRRAEMWTRLLTGGAMAYGLTHLIPNPVPVVVPGPGHDYVPTPGPTPNPNDFRLEGDFVTATEKGSIQSFINLKKEMIAHYKGLDGGIKYGESAEFANLTDAEVAQKLLATGKFDDLTGDIMRANNIQEFTQIAKDHGFLKVSGMGNSGVDSASIPAGSIVGMEPDSDGYMRFFVELPNGKHIPIDDNFGEALNQYKGVGLIDTTVGREPGPAGDSGNIGNQGEAGGGYQEDNTAPSNGDLDASDYGYGQNSATPGGAPEYGYDDNTAPEMVGTNETTVIGGDYIKDLYIHNPSINSPVGLYDYLFKNTDATIHVKPDWEVASRYANKEVPDFRLPGNADQRAYYRDLLSSGHASSITINGTEYMLPKHENSLNPSIERYDFAYKGNVIRYGQIDDYLQNKGNQDYDVLRAQTDHAYDQQPGQGTGNGVVDQVYEENLRKATDAQTNKWVDQSFGKNNIFGKHTNGTETRAWANMKNDTIGDHLKSRNSGGLRYSGTGKEKAFMSNLYNTARTYNVVLDPNESVESATRRVARAAMSAGSR